MIYSIIIAVIVVICVLLTLVVLLQSGQGEGLAGGIAGGMNMGSGGGMGARRTADLLSKATTVLGTSFLVLCVLANFFIDRGPAPESAVQQSGTEQPAPVDMNGPSQSPAAVPQQGQGQQGGGGQQQGGQGGGQQQQGGGN